MPPVVSVIIVNYNGYQDTIECLHSLKAQTGVDCTPLVIDNASQNGSAAYIRAAHPDVEVLETTRNLGFAGGNNAGIERALAQGCDFLFLVNNDTTLEPNCLHHLLACAQSRPDAAVIIPAIYYYGDKTKPWFTGSRASLENGIFRHDETDLCVAGSETPFDVPWVTGCAMLVPAARMREIGGFDPRYFCYYEDVDWSLRATEVNAACVLCPKALLYHKVFGSSPKHSKKIYYYEARNRLLCVAKHAAAAHRSEAVRRCTRETVKDARRMLIRPGYGEGKRRAIAGFLGVIDYHLRRFGPCRYSWL